MRNFEKLNFGDTVGLVCPSSRIAPDRIKECVKAVEALGYKVKLADNLDSNYAGYMAGDGKIKAYWINKMFADKDVKGIFCVRGGDGSSRLMEYLDYDVIRNNPKIFVGFSDITNLLLFISQKCGFVAFHGPMVSANMIDFDEESRVSFLEAINSDGELEFTNPKGYEIEVLREGKAKGVLVGGNLSLLSASVGTDYAIDGKDKIIFIEEVCESVSKVDKWMYHLRNAGVFEECKGVILGQFTDITNEQLPSYDFLCSIKDALEKYDFPIIYNIQAGHGEKNMTLPMGAECSFDTESKNIKFYF